MIFMVYRDFDSETAENIIVSYPRKDKATLPSGTNIIDLKEGIVYLADGTEERITRPLPTTYARSILLYTDCSISVSLVSDAGDVLSTTINPTYWRIGNVGGFNRIYLNCSKTTNIHLMCGTSTNGVPEVNQIPPSFPTLESGRQVEWEHLWTHDALPPMSITAHTVDSIGSGYRLLLKGAMISSSVDGIQRVWITKTPGLVGDCFFSRFYALTFTPSSEVSEGKTLTVYYKNNTTQYCRGTVSFIGVLEKL